MTVVKTKIAAVSYLNTVPFVYGINRADSLKAQLILAPPAQCAANFASDAAEVALVPVGALPVLNDANVVTDFCIGAVRNVRTVTLMSNVPVQEVDTIFLDSHSMTSALLIKVLAAELWHINPSWQDLSDYTNLHQHPENHAFLLIGDKVFDYEGRFKYSYDLAECWQTLTGKPFVFAVWVARSGVSPEVLDGLESALSFGVERIWEAISEAKISIDPIDAYSYLTENIDFLLDFDKRESLDLFLAKAKKFVMHPNPG